MLDFDTGRIDSLPQAAPLLHLPFQIKKTLKIGGGKVAKAVITAITAFTFRLLRPLQSRLCHSHLVSKACVASRGIRWVQVKTQLIVIALAQHIPQVILEALANTIKLIHTSHLHITLCKGFRHLPLQKLGIHTFNNYKKRKKSLLSSVKNKGHEWVTSLQR